MAEHPLSKREVVGSNPTGGWLSTTTEARNAQQHHGAKPTQHILTTVWPSGLRRWLQAPVRKGVGSNPTAVTVQLRCNIERIAKPKQTAKPKKRTNTHTHMHNWQDSLAEWSKALAQGASPQGRGFEPHSCHIATHTHAHMHTHTQHKRTNAQTHKRTNARTTAHTRH